MLCTSELPAAFCRLFTILLMEISSVITENTNSDADMIDCTGVLWMHFLLGENMLFYSDLILITFLFGYFITEIACYLF